MDMAEQGTLGSTLRRCVSSVHKNIQILSVLVPPVIITSFPTNPVTTTFTRHESDCNGISSVSSLIVIDPSRLTAQWSNLFCSWGVPIESS
ncbi:hypothetical protein P8C59_002767 [Phyllachora maydis]|uniref:Uncharacterized protein n=1 Tax=Phyllachora maydis TaxID=1825666 RepID=A0AAD9MBS0_9PEZI|nr:hypothetical protein P8C59_002767 [Phyllachora maydis]